MDLWPIMAGAFAKWSDNARGETPVSDLVAGVLAGKRQCWLVFEEKEPVAVALTKVEGMAGVITHAAGQNPDKWQGALLDAVEEWAGSHQLKRVRAIVRPGFTPFFKARGYRERTREMERDIG